MKNNKIKKLTLLFAAALTTIMMGNAAKAYAADIEIPSFTNGESSLYVQPAKSIPFDLKNGGTSGAPKKLCKVGSDNMIKIGFACCSDGQAVLNVYVDGVPKNTYTYTIPKSGSTWKTYYIPAPAGSTVKYMVRPDYSIHYSSAKGYFTVFYNE